MADAPKRRTFRKFTFRGIDLEKLMDLDSTAVLNLMHARVRRRFSRGLKRKPMSLIKRLRKVRVMRLCLGVWGRRLRRAGVVQGIRRQEAVGGGRLVGCRVPGAWAVAEAYCHARFAEGCGLGGGMGWGRGSVCRAPAALTFRVSRCALQEKTKVSPGEKPEVVKTHLRNMIIVPEMIGSVVGVYNGKVFNTVEIKVRSTPESYCAIPP